MLFRSNFAICAFESVHADAHVAADGVLSTGSAVLARIAAWRGALVYICEMPACLRFLTELIAHLLEDIAVTKTGYMYTPVVQCSPIKWLIASCQRATVR